MRFTSLSGWLAACALASSTCAFSLSKKHQRVVGSIHKSIQTTGGHIERGGAAFKLNVASAESVSVSDMERGMGGRLEEAFETAKAKGEAAFVAFITAGYPSKEGALVTDSMRNVHHHEEFLLGLPSHIFCSCLNCSLIDFALN